MILLNSSIGNYVLSNGRKFSYFGGNNYLGLASHPAVRQAAIMATEKYGVNFSASRRTSGTADIHLELENKLSGFKGMQDTVVFASGYQGNGILLEVLSERFTAVFIDEYAHSSIRYAAQASRKDVYSYKHLNPDHLESLLEIHKYASPLIITDGIFALTGEIAPLDRIYPLAKKFNAILIVDDAHSTGILGESGKGTPEHFNLPYDDVIYQSETMSKALGSYGGFIAGNRQLTEMIRDYSPTYQASTALPPPVVGACIASLGIIHENSGLRLKVLEKASQIRKEIIRLDFDTNKDETPIIPIMFKEMDKAKSLSSALENNGIIVPFMNYPSGQELYVVRIAVTATHTLNQAEELIEVLKRWRDKNQLGST